MTVKMTHYWCGVPRWIFVDWLLPRANGLAFLEWAKAHPRFKVKSIVALSGDISE